MLSWGEFYPASLQLWPRPNRKMGPSFSAKWISKTDSGEFLCEEGEEWNFAYVLPNHKGEPVEIVVPSALQMGWALSPPFFCAASETVRDVASEYAAEPIGALPQHPLEDKTMPPEDDVRFELPDTSKLDGKQRAGFLHLLEVYVDDFIQMA